MGQEYSNREIDRMFREIQEALLRIETQTTRTNGRVNKIENWKYYINGAIAIIGFAVIPMGAYILNKIL